MGSTVNAAAIPARWSPARPAQRRPAQDAGHGQRALRMGQGQRHVGERAAYLELLSHELRTPVTSIHAAATILRAREPRTNDALRTELVEDIAEESQRLLRTIEDVLMLAQLEAGVPMRREPLLLQRIVPLLLSGECLRRPGVGIELVESGPLPLVEGDESGLAHVIRDLLAESGASAQPYVMVELRASGADGAEVHVVDGGPERPASFALSHHASQRVMEAMGGRTWVRPRADGRIERGLWLPAYRRMADD